MSDGRANALPCPPLATPMHHGYRLGLWDTMDTGWDSETMDTG